MLYRYVRSMYVCMYVLTDEELLCRSQVPVVTIEGFVCVGLLVVGGVNRICVYSVLRIHIEYMILIE